MNFMTFHMLEESSQLTFIFFRGVETTNMHQPIIIINGGFKGTSPGHWRFDHRVSILNACCPVCRKWPSQSLFRDFYHDFLAQSSSHRIPVDSPQGFLLRPLNMQQKSKPIDMLAHILHLPFVGFIMLCRNFSWRVSSFFLRVQLHKTQTVFFYVFLFQHFFWFSLIPTSLSRNSVKFCMWSREAGRFSGIFQPCLTPEGTR